MRWLVAAGFAGCAGSSGGPVDGPADTHCDGADPVVVDPGTCLGPASSRVSDAGDDYGDTMFGTAGDDDDCKYHVEWSAPDGISRKGDTTIDLTLTHLADGSPATTADPRVEAFLDETTPAAAPGTSKEGSDGHYTITGVQFGEKGQWTVRFHFYEDCVDGETSPHGHAAFYADVP